MNTNDNIWLFLGGIGAIVLIGFIIHPALGILLLLGSIPLILWSQTSNWTIKTTKSTPIDPNMESASQDNKPSVAEDSASQDKQPSVAKANEPQNSESKNGGSFVGGMFLILFINLLVFYIGVRIIFVGVSYSYGPDFILQFIGSLFSTVISLGQLVYVIPLVKWLRKWGWFMLAKGVIAGAVITALLNGGCFLMLISGSVRF